MRKRVRYSGGQRLEDGVPVEVEAPRTNTRRVSGGPLGRMHVDLPSSCVIAFELKGGTVEACVRNGKLRLRALDGRLAFTSESTNNSHVEVWP